MFHLEKIYYFRHYMQNSQRVYILKKVELIKEKLKINKANIYIYIFM